MNRLKITITKKQETMKKHLLKTRLLSFAALCGIALTFASCAKDDVAQNPAKPDDEGNKNLTTFVAGGENKTRTSLNYNSGDFYWEAGDYIYVKDDDGVLRKSTNAPTSKVAAFKYKVPGKFVASSSYKVYYLGKNSNGSQVTISTVQTQTKPDNTEHFGTAGDYGTATATKATGKNKFAFELEHQPAYLVFQPYTSNTILQSCYLTKVEVSSDNDIAETYTFNPTTGALDASAVTDGDKIVLTTQDATSGSSYNNGFPLTNNSASVTTNGAYMVIKPGTHTLRVRYWVKDVATGIEGAITKIYPSTAYASNTYYDMTANLGVKNYDDDHYYMWDAQEQYWKGYEWTKNLPAGVGQPTFSGLGANPNYAKSNADSRWYHEGGGSGRFDATQSCATLPNVNEMTWYAAKGEPRWDNDELWPTMGRLYRGGIWVKKKAYISDYNSNTAVDGTDWRTDDNSGYWYVSHTLPSAADANKYFYLPTLGYYYDGEMINLNYGGSWSSSASPKYNVTAYYLYFSSNYIMVDDYGRSAGFWFGRFE